MMAGDRGTEIRQSIQSVSTSGREVIDGGREDVPVRYLSRRGAAPGWRVRQVWRLGRLGGKVGGTCTGSDLSIIHPVPAGADLSHACKPGRLCSLLRHILSLHTIRCGIRLSFAQTPPEPPYHRLRWPGQSVVTGRAAHM